MQEQNPQTNQQIHIQQQSASLPSATVVNQQEPAIDDNKKQKLTIIDERYRQIIQKALLDDEDEQKFDEYMQHLNGDIIQQHCGVIKIRKLFGDSKLSQLPQFKLQKLLQALKILCCQNQYPQLRLQSSWIIANLVGGTPQRCKIVIDKQFVGILITLLEDTCKDIVANAVWGLGNIAADCQENRFMLIKLKVIQKLISIVKTYQSLNIKHEQLYYWSISNLCRNGQNNLYQSIILAIPIYSFAFKEGLIKDQNTLCGCYWSLKHISEKRKGVRMLLDDEYLLPYLIEVVQKSEDIPIICPNIQILGEISKGDQHQTDLIMTQPLLQTYHKKLYHPKRMVRQDIVWIISNITAGSQRQIESILQHQILINRILELFEFDQSSIVKQIGFIFSNMVHGADRSIIFPFFARKQIVKRYVKALNFLQAKNLSNMLDSLQTIFGFAQMNLIEQRNIFVDQAISYGIEEILDKMVYFTNEQIQSSLRRIFKYLRPQEQMI